MTLLARWFSGVLKEFAPLFSARIWPQVQLLVVGALLSPEKRTVTAAVRVLGLADDPKFETFHRLLSRALVESPGQRTPLAEPDAAPPSLPWANRIWALLFLTAPVPSQRYHEERAHRHKTLMDWARQMIRVVQHW